MIKRVFKFLLFAKPDIIEWIVIAAIAVQILIGYRDYAHEEFRIAYKMWAIGGGYFVFLVMCRVVRTIYRCVVMPMFGSKLHSDASSPNTLSNQQDY
jgi:hypothetical protein